MKVTKGKLSIVLDEKVLKDHAEQMFRDWNSDLETATKLTKKQYKEEIEKLVSLAKEIMKTDEIFNYLPLTKSGKFHANKNFLLFQSKVGAWVGVNTLKMQDIDVLHFFLE